MADSSSNVIPVLYQSKGWKREEQCCRCSVKLGHGPKEKKRYGCMFCNHAVCDDCSPGRAMHPTTKQLERVCSSCDAIQLEGEIKSSFVMNHGKTEELEVKLEKETMARQQQEVKAMILQKNLETLRSEKEAALANSAKTEEAMTQLIKKHQQEEKQFVSALQNIEVAVCGRSSDRSISDVTQNIIRKHQDTVSALRSHSPDRSEDTESFPMDLSRGRKKESRKSSDPELSSNSAVKEIEFADLSGVKTSTDALLKAEVEKNADLTLQLNNLKTLTRQLEEQVQTLESRPKRQNRSADPSHNSSTHLSKEKPPNAPNRSHKMFREDTDEECQHCMQYRAVVSRLTAKVRDLQAMQPQQIETPRTEEGRSLDSCQCTLY